MIRTRFSPSPTGLLHIGNARTALFSALFASAAKGTFILRIEDTDAVRSERKYVTSLENDLHWLHIHWQEGPGVDGRFGPYFQSERQAIYDQYYVELEAKKAAYPCFCSDQELMLNRKIQLSRGQAPRYPGTCRDLTPDEIQQKIAAGLKPTLRFRIPKQIVEFVDTVKGLQKFNSDDIGDFIIRRADGSASFMFCNAIDDSLMQVTHVLRGEDHLANTPRQILILSALDLPAPSYGHLSLIANEDGSQLSKRLGSFSLNDFREQGYLPIALLNYLARLGHTIDSQELLSFDELANRFQLEKLSRSSARFDSHQLLFWQKTAVMQLDSAAAWRWLGDDIKKLVPENIQNAFIGIVKQNCCFPEEAKKWALLLVAEQVNFDTEKTLILKQTSEQLFIEAGHAVMAHGIDFKAVLEQIKKTTGLSGKNLFLPIRMALTGEMHGPELVEIAAILGKEKMIERFKRAFEIVSTNS